MVGVYVVSAVVSIKLLILCVDLTLTIAVNVLATQLQNRTRFCLLVGAHREAPATMLVDGNGYRECAIVAGRSRTTPTRRRHFGVAGEGVFKKVEKFQMEESADKDILAAVRRFVERDVIPTAS